MSSLQTNRSDSPIERRALALLLIVGTLGLLSGCIADTAEDTNLPWATNKSWEGIAPIAPTMMDQYE